MNRKERATQVLDDKMPGLKALLKMQIEERLECQQSKKVRYSIAEDIVLRLDGMQCLRLFWVDIDAEPGVVL